MELAAIITGAVGAVVSALTLAVLFMRGVFSIEHRLAVLETKIELFWDALRGTVADNFSQTFKAPGNPISQERWEYLLQKFKYNTLTQSEALELNNAFVEAQGEARQKSDNSSLLWLGLGLALIAGIMLSKRSEDAG